VTDPGLTQIEPRYAGLLRRLGALAIDFGIAYVVLSIAIAVIVPGSAADDPSSSEATTAAVIMLAVLLAWFAYLVVAEWRWGQTLGKRAVRIAVVDESGGSLSWGRALVRNLLRVVDVVAGLVLIPSSARSQRLGDRLAHTVVTVTGPRGAAAGVPASSPRPLIQPAPAAGSATPQPAAYAGPPPAPGSLPPPPAPYSGSPPPPVPFAEGPSTPPVSPPAATGPSPPAASPAPPPSVPPPPRSSGEPAATWGPGRVGLGILVLLVATVVEVGIVSVFDPNLDSLGARLVTQALLAVSLAVIAFWVGARASFASGAALGLRRPLRSPIWMAAAAYLSYIVFALVYSSFVHPQQEDVTRDLGFGQGTVGAIASGLLIVVAAPVSEEIFFRGFIFGGFRRRLPFPAAAVISALIFGLFHYTGPGSLGVVPQLAFLGLALCWLYEETGSIYPTMGVHALNNALAFAILTS
jgi:CAAX protease family protein